jgi:hypothetical protein
VQRARPQPLIDEALAGRPQRVSPRGAEVAVLVLAGSDRPMAPANFFRRSPLVAALAQGELDLERGRDAIRNLPWRTP